MRDQINLSDLHLEDSLGLNEDKDCAVRAVAIVSGETYRSVHAAFARAGRRPRKATSFFITCSALVRLGLKIENVRAQFKAKTIVTLGRELPKKGSFLIRVKQHILAAVDGEILDWTDGRRHRITEIWEVT